MTHLVGLLFEYEMSPTDLCSKTYGGWSGTAIYSNAKYWSPKSGCPHEAHVHQMMICKGCLQVIPDWLVKMPIA